MGEDSTSLGSIHISPAAVASIAYHAALQSYGVVGLAPRNLAEGLAITRVPSRGVAVHFDGEHLDITLHIIVAYGTPIASVADSVANTVRFHVEKALGMPVRTIEVHVAGIKTESQS